MAYTAKQLRNGATGDGGEQQSAQVGPGADVAGLMSTAEAAADARKRETAGFMQSPQGSGVGGHELGAGGDIWQWDSGLAINDVEGGGSG